MARSDKDFALMAISMKLLTQERAEEGLRLVARAKEVGLNETLAEVLVKKGYLNRAQEAAVNQALNQPRISRIGKYQLLARIGQGGMGTVYKARQESLDKIVALKVMAPSLARQRDFVERFIREAQASGRLNHPNVVQAIDAGEADGYYYFAMEFVDGESLREVLERDGKLPERRALEITAAVAAGLEHAHANNIVHRDIKPANIFLTREGLPKLGDLGLAKEIRSNKALTQAGIPVGTPYYISPEQARGQEDVDQRADIYALGATLYRMVAGDVPYEGPTGAVVMTMHLNDPIPDPRRTTPGLSDACVAIIHRCMAKRREDRYQNARELREDILLALAGRPLKHAAKPQPRAAPLAARLAARQAEAAAARRRMLLGGAIAGGIVVAIAAVALLASSGGGRQAEPSGKKAKLATAQPPAARKTAKTPTPPKETPVPKVVAKPDPAAVLRELQALAADSEDRADIEKRFNDFVLDYPGTPSAAVARGLLADYKARWKALDDFRQAVEGHIREQRFAEARAALAAPSLKEKPEKVKALIEELAGRVHQAAQDWLSSQTHKGQELLHKGDLAAARELYERLAASGLPEAAEASQAGLKKLAELAAARERRAAGNAFAELLVQAAPLIAAGKLQEARDLFDPAGAGENKALAELLEGGQADLARLAELFDDVARELSQRAANKGRALIRGIRRPIASVENGMVHCAIGGSFSLYQLRSLDLDADDFECLKDKKALLGLLELYRGDAAAARGFFEQHAPKPPDAQAARWLQQLAWLEARARESEAAKLLADARALFAQGKLKEASDALNRLGDACGETAFAEKHAADIGELSQKVADAIAATIRKDEPPKPFIDVTDKLPELAKAFKSYKVAGGWVIDINGNGMLDIALDIRRKPGDSRLVPVFLNETKPGSGQLVFRDATREVGLDTGDEPICWADFDGDGDLDVVCRGLWGAGPRADPAKLSFYENTGKGTPLFRLDPARSIAAELGLGNYGFANIAVTDVNCDGRPDIIAHYIGPIRTLSLFGSRPRPFAFDDVTEAVGWAVRKGKQLEPPPYLSDTAWLQYVALDYDGDDRPDLLLTGAAATLLHNARRSFGPAPGGFAKFDTYVSPATGNSPIIIPAVADYNNDGQVDIFVPQKGKNLLLRNTGDGRFVDAMHTTGPMATHEDESLWATWADVNNDGLLDLFVCNATTRNRLYIQKGNRAFIDYAPEYGVAGELGEKTNYAVFADLDRDGDLDMIVFREGGRSQVLLNPYAEGNNRYYASVFVRTRLGATGAKVALLRPADQAIIGLQQVGRVEGFNRQTPFEAFFGVPAAGDYLVKAVLTNGVVIRERVTVRPDARNEAIIRDAR